MRRLQFMLVMTALLTGTPEILAAATYDPRTPPTTVSGPVVVSVRFQVLDFARVNSRDESFDVTGYLEMSWTDPRLALQRKTSNPKARYFKASEVWIPRVYFANALDQPRDHGEPDVEVDSEGHVSLGRIFLRRAERYRSVTL